MICTGCFYLPGFELLLGGSLWQIETNLNGLKPADFVLYHEKQNVCSICIEGICKV